LLSKAAMDSVFAGMSGGFCAGQGPTFTTFRSRRTPASPAIIGFALTWQGDARLRTCLPGHDPEQWIPVSDEIMRNAKTLDRDPIRLHWIMSRS
jgi:hypothetical protein